jgi:hypothetical protein
LKRHDLIREASGLLRREAWLAARFIDPYLNISKWDPEPLDMAAAYVGLLHAESEGLIESCVRSLLVHASICASRGYCHPVLANALLYYQHELGMRLHVQLVPKRTQLEADPALMETLWRSTGAVDFWENRISQNHGAGMNYLESLLHPLGIAITERSFSKIEASTGVRRLATTTPGLSTELYEFVQLRGRAVHTSAQTFLTAVSTLTPANVELSGLRAAKAISGVTSFVARSVW